MRSASLRAPPEGDIVHQFHACSGELVRFSNTVHCSRLGESKFTMNGGATVRFQ
jgi:hypothetical protein